MSNLVQALKPRAALLAELIASRAEARRIGDWNGYSRKEGIEGVLETHNHIRFWRPGHKNATIRFGSLQLISIVESHRSEPVVIKANIEERKLYRFDFDKLIEYDEAVKHTFSKTITEQEAAKEAWKVGAKASIAVGFGPVKGSVEASAEYGRELNRQAGNSTTVSDEVTKSLKFKGPIHIELEAYRSHNTERKIITATADLDHTDYWESTNAWGIITFDTYKTNLIPVINGNGAESDSGFALFNNRMPTQEEVEELNKTTCGEFTFPVEYSNVLTQTFREI